LFYFLTVYSLLIEAGTPIESSSDLWVYFESDLSGCCEPRR